ncbi:hypothetical protein AG1IA_01016 [Rhizoctonia solani AG-1 IA]|uniref:Uncharacterized protein n=1 Tax=Thanatephorus cucumeris (strain AG1-IA) TaxID=983506 RepID=L8X8I7_THACA|nr:hypothetical protein AG1IA_01016 [Rhizoctonia solani AG-1 IA]
MARIESALSGACDFGVPAPRSIYLKTRAAGTRAEYFPNDHSLDLIWAWCGTSTQGGVGTSVRSQLFV